MAKSILISNNIHIKDLPLSADSKILSNYKSPYEATLISRLKSAGVEQFLQASSGEFGTSFDSEIASKVASDQANAALSLDTVGEARISAKKHSLFAFRPSYGAVSRYGIAAFAGSFDAPTITARSIDDIVEIYSLIRGKDSKDPTTADQQELNLASEFGLLSITNYTTKSDQVLADQLKASFEVSQTEAPSSDFVVLASMIITTAEASTTLSRLDGVRYGARVEGEDIKELYSNTRTAGFSEPLKTKLLFGSYMLSSTKYESHFVKAQRLRNKIKTELAKILDGDKVALLSTADEIDTSSIRSYYESARFTSLASLAGAASLTLPNGLQLLSFNESALLSAATKIENQPKG